ncbi:MAG: diaminopimelate epimerase [Tenuifilum sp.]|jgi:diaminopimelate epimerase|uniref:diaminopimelate epimerase n=1 Tax=Tenuifilum sp. TaxID=2760880 RepID=UPI0024AB95F6|nr:diaminopimelate epimerase [Tenuifilum sp.]MDI3527982.1 diaminopimelate epimerase [Tenuifilum sp.]
MNLQFFKYQGAGNDFIIIDNRKNTFSPQPNVINKLCNRHFGIGADGLILLEINSEIPFMRYFNSDGNEATMCGNGGRCFAAFTKHLGICNGDSIKFMGIDGEHIALFNPDGNIKLKMIDVKKIELIDDNYFLDTGSPHYVQFVRDIETVDVDREGKLIRKTVNFNNGGTNVNFVQEIKPGEIKIRTYERGVEAETLACGTGATAAAIAYSHYFEIEKNPIDVKAIGGNLKIYFERGNERFENVWLEGPAKKVFEGIIDIDSYGKDTI